MSLSPTILLTIALAPLVGALIAGLLRNQIGRVGASSAAIAGVAISCALSFQVLYQLVWGGAETFNQNIYPGFRFLVRTAHAPDGRLDQAHRRSDASEQELKCPAAGVRVTLAEAFRVRQFLLLGVVLFLLTSQAYGQVCRIDGGDAECRGPLVGPWLYMADWGYPATISGTCGGFSDFEPGPPYCFTENAAFTSAVQNETAAMDAVLDGGNFFCGQGITRGPLLQTTAGDTMGVFSLVGWRWDLYWHVENFGSCETQSYLISEGFGGVSGGSRVVVCPPGYSNQSGSNDCVRYKPEACKCGDPFQPAGGEQTFTETDIQGRGDLPLEFQRYYNSMGFYTSVGVASPLTVLGSSWQHNFQRSVVVEPAQTSGQATIAYVLRPDGDYRNFSQVGTAWVGRSDQPERLSALTNAGGQLTGWQYTTADDNVEAYDANGNLLSITSRSGRTLTLIYSTASTPATIAPVAGLLIQITDDSGRSIQLAYDSNSMLISMIDPTGKNYGYTYDANQRLGSVEYPGGTSRSYLYNESSYSSIASFGAVNLLTGILDENQARYATFTYDGNNLASSSWHGAQVDQFSVTYNAEPSGYPESSVVQEPLGMQRTKSFIFVNGIVKDAGETQPCINSSCTGSISTVIYYDSAGYLRAKSNFNGQFTFYTFDDTRGLEKQRIEASGTASQRTTSTVWDPNFRVPDQRSVVNANSVTEALTKWSYNSRGQRLSRCQVDPAVSDASSYICGSSTNAPTGVRQLAYTYCEQADVTAAACPLVGLTLSVDGPRTDVSDVTTYTYFQTTDESGCADLGKACHHLGDLQKVTSALGQTITYVSYDKNGRVTRMQDANGTYTDMIYHPRGWLLTRIVRANLSGKPSASDAKTAFAYDNVGNVKQVTQPDGAYLSYTYDDAHRLTDIADKLNNKIHYTLDAAGNRTDEKTSDTSGNLKRELSRQYDQLDHLLKTLNAANATVQSYTNPVEAPPSGITYTDGYDGNGNAIYSTDANGFGTEQQYDPLNRLVKSLQDHAGTGTTHDTTTQYAYDARDNLRSVTDPDNLPTNYTYDGLNNLTDLNSPDTGDTGYAYDAAGNRLTQTDANGITATYSYDALNRLTGIAYPTSSLNIGYAYDAPATGCYNIGRLTSMTDSSGSTTYCYDRRGNVLSKLQVTGGTTFTTSYTYTLADRIASITYPSGAIVNYGRDTVGRVTSVTYKANATATAQTILSNASYYPFGPANVLTFGNGRTLTKTYDQDYAIGSVASSDPNGLAITAGIDALGNIVHASNTPNANPPTRSYTYDPLYRLTGVTDASNAVLEGYSYDATGDRLSKTYQGANDAYTYTSPLTSHQLQNTSGTQRQYDADGNTVYIGNGRYSGSNSFAYDDRNRLSEVDHSAGACLACSTFADVFDYNGRGERVIKTVTIMNTMHFPTSVTATTDYVYNESGQLLGEYPGTSSVQTAEYIYLDAMPVAYITNGVLYYIETDQLGTPRAVVKPGATTAADTVVWTWDYFGSAFGEDHPNTDPGNTGTSFTFNLRFPGQYFDAETGLNYNTFRDYEPGTGRYSQSDPTGLHAGINTYQYVNSAPLSMIDPSGLVGWKGTYDIKALVVLLGGANGYFDLTSDCVDGRQFNAVVHYVGPAIGWGPIKVLYGGETGGSATFHDHSDNIDPSNLEGLAGFFSIGATVGSLSFEPGRFRLGDAFSDDMSNHGLDVGATLGLGSSTITSGKGWMTCDCTTKQ